MIRSVLEVDAPASKVMAALKDGLAGTFEVLALDDQALHLTLATARHGWSWGTRFDVGVVRLHKGTRLIIEARNRVAWNLTSDLETAMAKLLAKLQAAFPGSSSA